MGTRMEFFTLLALHMRITVAASSPTSRFTDPKVLVSRTYQLMCNYYTLRQDGSTTYIRCWALQCSMDGKNWINLRVHENDQTICKPGQYASWPVQGPAALLPFRFFRVVLTGPTTDDSNPWSLCICFLELYGFFR